MTELLCEWVNESLGLDPPTGPRSLELDVTSGYLLGCLLERYNQLDPASANKLKDKRDSDAHVSNYCAIEPTMRALKIKFDAQVASALMGAKPGAASRVLYQLKMALDRIENFTAPVSVFAEKDGRKPLCSLPTRGPKPHFDRASTLLFESAVRRMVENHNDVLMRDHLQRFDDEADRVDARLERQKKAKLAGLDQHTMQTHANRLRAHEQERAFLSSWEAKGLEQWAENHEKARRRRAMKARVERRAEQKKAAAVEYGRANATSRLIDDIELFELKLAKKQHNEGRVEPRADSAPGAFAASATAPLDDDAALLGLDDVEAHERAERARVAAAIAPKDRDDALARPDVFEMAPVVEVNSDIHLDGRVMRKDGEFERRARADKKDAEDRRRVAHEQRRRRFITEREEAQVRTADARRADASPLSRSVIFFSIF